MKFIVIKNCSIYFFFTLPNIFLLKFVYFFVFYVKTTSFACPEVNPPCRCAPSINEPIAIICKNGDSLFSSLQAISNAKKFLINSLTIVDTNIPLLSANLFLEFRILRLVLNQNQLSDVDNFAFNGPLIESLVELDLSDNNLQQIPVAGVSQLKNLKKLYLKKNRIAAKIPAETFNYYASKNLLIKLELADNKITDATLSENVFKPLTNLQELSLETNALTYIPDQALQFQQEKLTNLNLGLNQIEKISIGSLNFSNLNSLSLEYNKISEITPEVFQKVPHLQYLYLTGNKFLIWDYEMFRYLNELQALGIGETPISVIPSNAFSYLPNLMRLEMSEAAVNKIEFGAFQKAPLLEAIVLNKNRLKIIHSHTFQNLNNLYSIDLQGNRINLIESKAFADLPDLRHLDLSFNQLETLPIDVFENSFLPLLDDRRVIYICANPWLCDTKLKWFRQFLRDNIDIDIEKPGCEATCAKSINNCPPEGTLLRSFDFCPFFDSLPETLNETTLSYVGWIILVVILTVLLISIFLMTLIRYGISYRHKKKKDQETEDYQNIISTAGSICPATQSQTTLNPCTKKYQPYLKSYLDLELPPAKNLDDRSNYYI